MKKKVFIILVSFLFVPGVFFLPITGLAEDHLPGAGCTAYNDGGGGRICVCLPGGDDPCCPGDPCEYNDGCSSWPNCGLL